MSSPCITSWRRRCGLIFGFGVATAFGLVAPGHFASANAAPLISGEARVVDGDTVVVAGTKIRLNGIDAPETDQLCLTARSERWTCGVEARERLSALTNGKVWTCEETGRDRYGRSLADCAVEGRSVNRWMVEQGWSLAFVRYSHRYEAEEREARTANRGLWTGAFIAPWDWRSRNRETMILGALSVPVGAQKLLLAPASEEAAPVKGCVIKGNVNRIGACIYHLPSGRYYAKTQIDESKGERWYCTAEEAEAAGCRKSAQ